MLGQDVDLVLVDLNALKLDFTYRQSFPILGPIVATLAGDVHINIHFAFGYDTKGFREFVASKDVADLADGLFVDTSGGPNVAVLGGIFVGGGIDFGIASGGVEGGITLGVTMTLHNDSPDGKLRFGTIVNTLATMPECLFDIHGEINAVLRAWYKINLLFFKIEGSIELGKAKLWEFNVMCPKDPILADVAGDGALNLNMGPRAKNRLNGPTADDGESFTVSHVSGDSNGETVRVKYGASTKEFSGVKKVVVDTGTGDNTVDLRGVKVFTQVTTGAGNNKVFVGDGGSLINAGPGGVAATGGAGPDVFAGGDGNDSFVAGTGTARVTGGGGANTVTNPQNADVTLVESGDVNFTLSDGTLNVGSAGVDTFDATVRKAELTGGPSGTTFDVSGWTGTAALAGNGPAVVLATTDTDFTLTDAALTRKSGGVVTLSGVGVAKLTGGGRDNSFDLTGWTGSGQLDGGAGTDTVTAINDANFTLADTSLDRSARSRVGLRNVETAVLTGGGADTSFTVSDWSGTGRLDGAGGQNRLLAIDPADFTLTDATFDRTGRGQLVLGNLQDARLTGAADDNTFTISGWTGTATIDGVGGTNTVAATNDVDFVLADARLTRTSRGVAELANVGRARLTGGAADNRFEVSGWTGKATVSGNGGADTVISTNPASFALSDGGLTRSTGGTFALVDVRRATLTGGSGDDSFDLGGWTGKANLDGGVGQNTVIATATGSFTLTDGSLVVAGGGQANLKGVTRARLQGGLGDTTFMVAGFTGKAVLVGGTGYNTVSTADAASYSLSDDALVRSTGGTFSLRNVPRAFLGTTLAGGQFDVTGFTGTATLVGYAGSTTVVAAADADFGLSDTLLQLSSGGRFKLVNVTRANLNALGTKHTLTAAGWTGTALFLAADGHGTLSVSADAAGFTVMAANVVQSDGVKYSLRGVDAVNVTGSPRTTAYTVADFVGKLTLAGGAPNAAYSVALPVAATAAESLQVTVKAAPPAGPPQAKLTVTKPAGSALLTVANRRAGLGLSWVDYADALGVVLTSPPAPAARSNGAIR